MPLEPPKEHPIGSHNHLEQNVVSWLSHPTLILPGIPRFVQSVMLGSGLGMIATKNLKVRSPDTIGSPDLNLICGGRVLGIELKFGSDTPRASQWQTIPKFLAAGAGVLTLYSNGRADLFVRDWTGAAYKSYEGKGAASQPAPPPAPVRLTLIQATLDWALSCGIITAPTD